MVEIDMPDRVDYYPIELYFTKESILPYFENGTTIHGEIERMKKLWWFQSREKVYKQYLPLQIGKDRRDGKWYCNNNRRLYFFRVLEKLGYVKAIKTIVCDMEPRTPDAGCHIKFRGGDKTYDHCNCNKCFCNIL